MNGRLSELAGLVLGVNDCIFNRVVRGSKPKISPFLKYEPVHFGLNSY